MAKKSSNKKTKSGSLFLKKVSDLYVIDGVGLFTAIWYAFMAGNSIYDSMNTGSALENDYYALLMASLLCVLFTMLARKKIDNWNSFILGILLTSASTWFFIERYYVPAVF